MKVVIFVSSQRHGLAYLFVKMACELAERGLEVEAVTLPGEQIPGLRSDLDRSGIRLHLIDGLGSLHPVRFREASRNLAAVLERFEPDLVQTWGIRQFLVTRSAVGHARAHRRIRICVSVQSLHHGSLLWRAWYAVGCYLLRTADLVMPLCQDEYRKLVRHGQPRKKASVLPNWVHLPDFEYSLPWEPQPGWDIPPEAVKCACVAQLSPRKGHKYLLKAAAMVRRKGHDLHLLLAGGPAGSEEDLRLMAADLRMTDYVHFLGRIGQRQVPSLLRYCDLCVCPSLAETFGVSIIEPLVVSRPVISTRVGVAWELEMAGGAILAPPRDACALADGMLMLIEHASVAAEMVAKGNRYVLEHFSTERVAERLQALYLSLWRHK